MDKIQRHKELCEKMNKTYCQKNEKYGDSFSTSVQKYGYIAALTRISDKFHRIENLILTKTDGSDTDESLIDSLLDLSNYCLMTVIELESDADKKCKCDCDCSKDIVITPADYDKYDKAISNTIKKENDVDLWKVAKDTIKPTKPTVEWKYEDGHRASDVKEVDMEPSIEPDWTYISKSSDNRKKKQILCEGD